VISFFAPYSAKSETTIFYVKEAEEQGKDSSFISSKSITRSEDMSCRYEESLPFL